MRTHKFIGTFLSLVTLCACQGGTKAYEIKDYRQVLTSTNDTFSILQLTDIHWCYTTKIAHSEEYLTQVFEAAKKEAGHLDLIVITGDSFLGADQAMVTELYRFVNGWGVPFAVTYGNHDKEGDWSREWMNEAIQKGENALSLPYADDGIDGDTNYFIDWSDGNDTVWRIYLLDSNSLTLESPFSYGYDGIHENQVGWMKNVHDTMNDSVPSLGFVHIPPKELAPALQGTASDKSQWILGKQHEKTCQSSVDSSFVQVAKEIGMRGVFYGHDHNNDFVLQDQDGFVMGYGVKSGTELYSYEDPDTHQTLTGGALYTLKKDGAYDLTHLYVDDHEGYAVSSLRKESLR